MKTDKDLESRLEAVERRNLKVAADKAWETSDMRKIIIAVLTYMVIGSYLTAIHNPHPWINAVVPVVGFLLSTLVLAQIKALWIERRFRR